MVSPLLGRIFYLGAVCISLSTLGIIFVQEKANAMSEKISLGALLEIDPHDMITIDPENLVNECTTYLSSSAELSPSQRYRLHLLRGYAYLHTEKNANALQDFEDAAKLHPKNDLEAQFLHNGALGNRALCSGDQKKIIQALTEAADLIKRSPGSAKAYDIMARYHGAIGNLQECITCCDKSIALDKCNSEAFFFRGLAHKQVGDSSEALEDLDNCIRLGGYGVGTKAAAAPFLLRAQIRLDPLDDPTLALRDLNMASKLDPNSLEVKFAVWHWYIKQGKYDAASHLSKKMSGERPESISTAVACIVSFLHDGTLNNAFKCAEKMISQSPDRSHGYYWRGIVYFAKGDYDDALRDLERASRINGSSLHIQGAKAYLMASVPAVRNGSEALKLAAKCCEQTRYKNAQYLMVLAMGQASAGHMLEAVKYGRESLDKLNPSSHLREEYEYRVKLFMDGKMYNYSPQSKVLDYLFF